MFVAVWTPELPRLPFLVGSEQLSHLDNKPAYLPDIDCLYFACNAPPPPSIPAGQEKAQACKHSVCGHQSCIMTLLLTSFSFLHA